jgi:hypothetical protein
LNVNELFKFSDWFLRNSRTVQTGYQQLGQALQHNATQAQKQPVSEPMKALRATLTSMPMEQLTNEQIELLRYLDIAHLLGREGSAFVKRTVVRGDFDPATAAKEIQDAGQSISNAIHNIDQIRTAMKNLPSIEAFDDEVSGRVTIRVQFKEEASISDVAEWKKWSNEWHEIVRGVALCVNESPEDTRVIGATKGSLVMVLSGTIAFVSALALITKHLSFIVKEGLVIANAIEDLRHKKILNKTIENSLNGEKKKLIDDGVKKIVAEAKKSLPAPINGEQEAALTKAVEKFMRFNELGGDVDFVSPSEPGENDGGEPPINAEEIAHIRQVVEQIREIRSEVKLLSHMNDEDDAAPDGEDDDEVE